MRSTVDIRVVGFVKLAQSVDYAQRLLRGGTVVEPNEVVPVYLLIKNRELLADFLRVESIHLVVSL